jgi:hypothetical protein
LCISGAFRILPCKIHVGALRVFFFSCLALGIEFPRWNFLRTFPHNFALNSIKIFGRDSILFEEPKLHNNHLQTQAFSGD